MIPIHDENPTHSFPLITLILIGLNAVVFFHEVTAPVNLATVFQTYGLVPSSLVQAPVQHSPNFFSAMFLHAGLAHLLGNMLYLWIFGNNIEDVLGKPRFIIFYFFCGVIAALCHVMADVNSQIPMVGASGAISGVLGAYLVLFPKARVKTLVFLGFFITILRIPAGILLLFWIGLQLLNNMSLGSEGGGVAWMAHIGGFVAGAVLILPFKLGRPRRPYRRG